MAEVTTTTAAAFLGEEWTDFTIDAAEFAMVLQATVRHVPSQTVQGNRTIHVPHVSNLTANTKTQGTDVTYEAITQTNQDITINTWRYVAMEVNSLVDVQSRYDLIEEYSDKMGYALARGFETDLAALAQNISAIVGVYGVEFTEDDFNAAVILLDNAGAPTDGRYWWASPAFVANIRKIDKFVSSDFVGGENARAIENATVGRLLGAEVVQSALLRAPAGGQHDNLYLHKNQLLMVMQMAPKTEKDRIIDSLTDAVVAHAIHTVAEAEIPAEAAGSESLGDSFGVLLKSV
jgi:hypothetical protein